MWEAAPVRQTGRAGKCIGDGRDATRHVAPGQASRHGALQERGWRIVRQGVVEESSRGKVGGGDISPMRPAADQFRRALDDCNAMGGAGGSLVRCRDSTMVIPWAAGVVAWVAVVSS